MQLFVLVFVVVVYDLMICECTLSETLKSTSVCFGNTQQVSLICEAGGVIAIDKVIVGAHKSSSGCNLTWTEGSNTTCCTSVEDDCSFGLETKMNQNYLKDCNGKALCSPSTDNAEITDGLCANATEYPPFTHYMFVDYYCIEESRILKGICAEVSNKRVKNSTVYLWNDGFPGSFIPASSSNCSCSIESDNCNAPMQVITIQSELTGNSNDSCDQLLSLAYENGTEIKRWDCTNNTVTIETLPFSANYVTFVLQNNRSIDNGNFWVGFQASETANLLVNCPAIGPTVCLPTTTTTVTTSTTLTTTRTTETASSTTETASSTTETPTTAMPSTTSTTLMTNRDTSTPKSVVTTTASTINTIDTTPHNNNKVMIIAIVCVIIVVIIIAIVCIIVYRKRRWIKYHLSRAQKQHDLKLQDKRTIFHD